MIIQDTIFNGYECLVIHNDAISVWIAKQFGPRILGIAREGGENIFAELPNARLELPNGKYYSLRGGHRLWYAPEEPSRTYLPDDEPVHIIKLENEIQVTQPVEKETGIQKTILVKLPDHSARVIVDHQLTNRGDQTQELAPWVITMLKPGGYAILPQTSQPADKYGLLPNRSIALWPYTDIQSQHIQPGNRFILIHANMQEGALKVGFSNRRGWLGYYNNGILFVKLANYDPELDYYDYQSSSECWCNPDVIEIETLGPRIQLQPGQTIMHREEWRLFSNLEIHPDEENIQQCIDKLKINQNVDESTS